MPYKTVKQDCKRSDGRSGKYVLKVKPKPGKYKGRKRDSKGFVRIGCHTSKDAVTKQRAAIEAPPREGVSMKITAGQLRQIIKEELTSLSERVGDGELSPEEAEALRRLVGDASRDALGDRPSYLPDVKSKSLPSWAEAVRKDMMAMKTASGGDHFKLAMQVNKALDEKGIDFESDSPMGDQMTFYKDGKELASLDIDGLQDASAVSKAWADIVRQLGIS